MSNDHKSKGEDKNSKLIGQHKRLAMGEKVTGMKKGGMAFKKSGAVKKGGK